MLNYLERINIVHFIVDKNMSEKDVIYNISADTGELLPKDPAYNVLQLESEVPAAISLIGQGYLSYFSMCILVLLLFSP